MTSNPAGPRPLSTEAARHLLDAAPDGIVVVAHDGCVLVANRAASSIFERSIEELIGMAVDELLPERLRHSHQGQRASYRAEPRMRPMGDPAGSVRLERPGGAELPVEIALSPATIEGEPVTIAIVRDISERLSLEREMLLVEDRERIARDLHDTVIQQLFATGMSLQAALDRPELLVARADAAIATLDATIAEIRQTIFQLRNPTSLLGDRLEELVDRNRRLGSATIEYSLEGDLGRVPSSLADHVVPVVNELVANAHRHAAAARITVGVAVDDRTIRVVVIDDGRGLDDDFAHGSGVPNLHRRAAAFGGSFTYSQSEAGGCRADWSASL